MSTATHPNLPTEISSYLKHTFNNNKTILPTKRLTNLLTKAFQVAFLTHQLIV